MLPKPRRPGSTDRLSTEARRPSAAGHRSSSAEPSRSTFGAGRLSREASATKLPINGVSCINLSHRNSTVKFLFKLKVPSLFIYSIYVICCITEIPLPARGQIRSVFNDSDEVQSVRSQVNHHPAGRSSMSHMMAFI